MKPRVRCKARHDGRGNTDTVCTVSGIVATVKEGLVGELAIDAACPEHDHWVEGGGDAVIVGSRDFPEVEARIGLEAPATFRKDLESLLNRYSKENGSNTPDFLLAEYLDGCLGVYDRAVKARDAWYGVSLSPGRVKLTGGDE